jgi:uncharacterized membrane protein YccC
MFAILLQISPTADTTFWSRVADQAFSIVLLVAVALLLWRQYKSLEARLNKYMEEDRQKMLDIISNNTRVMERIEDHLDKK